MFFSRSIKRAGKIFATNLINLFVTSSITAKKSSCRPQRSKTACSEYKPVSLRSLNASEVVSNLEQWKRSSFYTVSQFKPMSSREYPKVWDRFERSLEGSTMKFVVEDISKPMWSTAVEFMLGNYIKEDVWWSTAGTAQDPEAVQEYRVLLTSIIKQKMSLACFLAEGDGSGHILVGVNLCMPQKKGYFVDHVPPKTEAGLLSLLMFAEAMKLPVIYDKYGVAEYLMGTGLSVAPEYRRLGIGTRLLTARIGLSKSLGFRVTGGIFTSATGQKAAEKAGMECLYSLSYKKFGKRCNIRFNSSTEDLKIFGIKTE